MWDNRMQNAVLAIISQGRLGNTLERERERGREWRGEERRGERKVQFLDKLTCRVN